MAIDLFCKPNHLLASQDLMLVSAFRVRNRGVCGNRWVMDVWEDFALDEFSVIDERTANRSRLCQEPTDVRNCKGFHLYPALQNRAAV
jgi:hypothetical protein